MRYILGCRIFANPQFVLDLGVPLPWFFIITGFIIINHVDIVILECYPGWLPSKTCWPSMGYFSFVWEDPPDLSSMRLSRLLCCSVHGQICGAVLRCGAVSLFHVCLFRSRRPFIFGGPFRIVYNIYVFASSFKSSRVVVHFRNGKLALGVVINFLATLASHDVALLLSSSTSSSKLRFLKDGGVTDSVGGMFSLSELIHSGSSKNLGLYLCSVRLGHSPESEVILLSFFQGVNTPGSFWGTCFPSLTSFFQGQNFSVHFSVSSTNVWFPSGS